MELPHFKYSPNAFSLNIFVEEEGICSACDEERTIRYNSSFYSYEEQEYICPWCIENGNAALTLDGYFIDYESIENPKTINEDLKSELCERTPSYNGWQQEVWLTHCNQPCAFIGYADTKTIEPFMEELQDDINNIRYKKEFVLQNLSKDGRLVGYLFQCLICNKHRLHIDCD